MAECMAENFKTPMLDKDLKNAPPAPKVPVVWHSYRTDDINWSLKHSPACFTFSVRLSTTTNKSRNGFGILHKKNCSQLWKTMITDESYGLGSVFLFAVFWVCLHDPKTVTSMLLCIIMFNCFYTLLNGFLLPWSKKFITQCPKA